jgi:tetratricopeptide (TPR) repeat protein
VPQGPHPDPGLIAARAEGRLGGAEAARIDEHLASCSDCYDTFSETVRFVLEEEPADVEPRRATGLAGIVRRPAFRLAAALAAAAALLIALYLRGGPGEPLVAELVRAMGDTRFVEPRVTGGFAYGRHVVLRADPRSGLDAHSAAVVAAVARIRERTEGRSSPEALGALAVTYLVSGDTARAVAALETATARDPGNPRLQSDLAAAYLAGAATGEGADLPKAVEAAERATSLPGAPDEAWFNRALALEHLHRVDAARKAWQDYLARDSRSGWADEARRRIAELPAP